MNQGVLDLARKLVRAVVGSRWKLARQVSAVPGSVDRRRRSFLKIAQNFDARTTIRRNLSNYDLATQRLYIRQPYFFSRVRGRPTAGS